MQIPLRLVALRRQLNQPEALVDALDQGVVDSPPGRALLAGLAFSPFVNRWISLFSNLPPRVSESHPSRENAHQKTASSSDQGTWHVSHIHNSIT
ncbi:hypothetical protein [Streptomyces sp. LS1784]|uniref:hypothetical protein n=1 Tax=Streptomyces sp. LS1784 TaxID=2851533 RepID=UPI001CCDB232|nr:hypothetical protein [Streptomyces sp. LS1784]